MLAIKMNGARATFSTFYINRIHHFFINKTIPLPALIDFIGIYSTVTIRTGIICGRFFGPFGANKYLLPSLLFSPLLTFRRIDPVCVHNPEFMRACFLSFYGDNFIYSEVQSNLFFMKGMRLEENLGSFLRPSSGFAHTFDIGAYRSFRTNRLDSFKNKRWPNKYT